MIDKLLKLPVSELLQYKSILDDSIEVCENKMQPFYGKATMFDNLAPEQLQVKEEWSQLNYYRSQISEALKTLVLMKIKELENGKIVRKSKKKVQ